MGVNLIIYTIYLHSLCGKFTMAYRGFTMAYREFTIASEKITLASVKCTLVFRGNPTKIIHSALSKLNIHYWRLRWSLSLPALSLRSCSGPNSLKAQHKRKRILGLSRTSHTIPAIQTLITSSIA